MATTKRLRVIIFEDDQALSDLLVTVIQGLGHEVLAFSDPTACPVYATSGNLCTKQFPCADVLITDNMMPNMSGLEFLKLQRERGCKALDENKALMSSAMTKDQQQSINELGCHFFRKPFKIKELKNWLDKCSSRTPDGRTLAQL